MWNRRFIIVSALQMKKLIHRLAVCAKSLQMCPNLCEPVDCSPPGSSVHGILQARILKWVPTPSSWNLPDLGIEPTSLTTPALVGRFFTIRAIWEVHIGLAKITQFNNRRDSVQSQVRPTSEYEIFTTLLAPCIAFWFYTLGLVCWSSRETGKRVTGEVRL